MKKLTTAVLLSTALLAGAAQANWEGNWLLGISGGYEWRSDNDVDYTIFHPAAAGAPVDSFSTGHDNGDHGLWGFLVGYQARCNQWLVGLEFNVDWRGDSDDNNAFAITDSLAQNWVGGSNWDKGASLGLTARFGYEMAPYFMPYIRLGAQWSKDQLDIWANTVNPAIINADGSVLLVSASGSDRTSTRFVGGVGFEIPIVAWNCVSIRVEWNYVSKGKDVEASALASDNLTLWTADSSASTNLIKAALVWNFL